MPVHRFPVLVWQDFDGGYTAQPVGLDSETAAFDASSSGALRQVRTYLQWLYKRQPWMVGPEILDAQLLHVPVTLRPQYQTNERAYPCDEMIELRVACVRGQLEGGLYACALPMLGIQFHYFEPDLLRRLVTEKVRDGLSGRTPQQLSRFLAPRQVRLELVSVKAPATESNRLPLRELPALTAVAEPLGQPSVRRLYSRAWQRETEVHDLVERLTTENANLLLLGESGVGKTTLLVNAVRIVERQRTELQREQGFTHRFWRTSAARLIAGMKYLGQWEERCEQLIEELSHFQGVLCIDSLLDLLLLGGCDPTDSLAAFFLPYLQSSELRMIAEVTSAELDACRRQLPGLVESFRVLAVRPLPPTAARQALEQYAAQEGQESKVDLAPETVPAVDRLFRRFLPYQPLPGRAAPFVAELVHTARQYDVREVTAADAVELFIRQTGLPAKFLRDEALLPVEEIEADFRRHVVGQDAAVRAAANVVAAFKAGLNDPQRPLGVLLFAGPTGVGKTELAKTLSRYLFGHGQKTDRLVRLDMSEYSSWDAAERLLSKPDRTPSELVSRVRQQPFVVVLFDEVEKAHPDVFDVLLGLFDEGRLTDRFGRTTNFKSAIVIMTSNLGANRRQSVGFGEDSVQPYESEVKSFFRPEFFNRIDSVVTFQPLAWETCLTITRKELDDIARREGFTKRNLRLSYSSRLVEHFTRTGFDARYGARPLQRTLETQCVARLSQYLVNHPDLRSAELRVDLDDQERLQISHGTKSE
jgi:ATP-dependent Clp protease ATP-binding subunit ClpC